MVLQCLRWSFAKSWPNQLNCQIGFGIPNYSQSKPKLIHNTHQELTLCPKMALHLLLELVLSNQIQRVAASCKRLVQQLDLALVWCQSHAWLRYAIFQEDPCQDHGNHMMPSHPSFTSLCNLLVSEKLFQDPSCQEPCVAISWLYCVLSLPSFTWYYILVVCMSFSVAISPMTHHYFNHSHDCGYSSASQSYCVLSLPSLTWYYILVVCMSFSVASSPMTHHYFNHSHDCGYSSAS